ncbi:MAG: DUF433 domain-containing protein [Pirellulaceae bacterium]
MVELDRITFDPQVMGGKPCIRGMRVTVGTIGGPRRSMFPWRSHEISRRHEPLAQMELP